MAETTAPTARMTTDGTPSAATARMKTTASLGVLAIPLDVAMDHASAKNTSATDILIAVTALMSPSAPPISRSQLQRSQLILLRQNRLQVVLLSNKWRLYQTLFRVRFFII